MLFLNIEYDSNVHYRQKKVNAILFLSYIIKLYFNVIKCHIFLVEIQMKMR